jgi:RNA polymerase sigma factor (sigma-70 family)
MQIKTDRELLESYATDSNDAAFAELVVRYSPMVHRACLRVLGNASDAEDATQAAFLVLARKAGSLRQEGRLNGWLHRVARQVALQALRVRADRERRQEQLVVSQERMTADASEADTEAVFKAVDAELDGLSAILREAVVLRYLRGLSEQEAAAQAGCPVSAMKWRTSDGIAKLRQRLSKRGVALGGVALAGLLTSEASAAIPETLLPSILATVKTALATTATALPGVALGAKTGTSTAAMLAKGAMKAMFIAKVKMVAAVAAAVIVTGTAVPVGIAVAQAANKEAGKKPEAYLPSGGIADPDRLWLPAKKLATVADAKAKWEDPTPISILADHGNVFVLAEQQGKSHDSGEGAEIQCRLLLFSSHDRGNTWDDGRQVDDISKQPRHIKAAIFDPSLKAIHLLTTTCLYQKEVSEVEYLRLSLSGGILARRTLGTVGGVNRSRQALFFMGNDADGRLHTIVTSERWEKQRATSGVEKVERWGMATEEGWKVLQLMDYRLIHRVSNDGGETWSEAREIMTLPVSWRYDEWRSLAVCGRGFVGTFFDASESNATARAAGQPSVGFVVSRDGGINWTNEVLTIRAPVSMIPFAASAEGQRIVLLGWAWGKDVYCSTSDDGGRSWSDSLPLALVKDHVLIDPTMPSYRRFMVMEGGQTLAYVHRGSMSEWFGRR